MRRLGLQWYGLPLKAKAEKQCYYTFHLPGSCPAQKKSSKTLSVLTAESIFLGKKNSKAPNSPEWWCPDACTPPEDHERRNPQRPAHRKGWKMVNFNTPVCKMLLLLQPPKKRVGWLDETSSYWPILWNNSVQREFLLVWQTSTEVAHTFVAE